MWYYYIIFDILTCVLESDFNIHYPLDHKVKLKNKTSVFYLLVLTYNSKDSHKYLI